MKKLTELEVGDIAYLFEDRTLSYNPIEIKSISKNNDIVKIDTENGQFCCFSADNALYARPMHNNKNMSCRLYTEMQCIVDVLNQKRSKAIKDITKKSRIIDSCNKTLQEIEELNRLYWKDKYIKITLKDTIEIDCFDHSEEYWHIFQLDDIDDGFINLQGERYVVNNENNLHYEKNAQVSFFKTDLKDITVIKEIEITNLVTTAYHNIIKS